MEETADDGAQGFHFEWLVQQHGPERFGALTGFRVTERGHDDDRHVHASLSKTAHDLEAGVYGHANVRNEQIDGRGHPSQKEGFLDSKEQLRTVSDFVNFVSFFSQTVCD